MSERSDLLMLHGVVFSGADCGDERIFVPTDDPGALCCTSCDAAVFVFAVSEPSARHRTSRVA
jgi:hypothetical protein